jgi:hypothetical protein
MFNNHCKSGSDLHSSGSQRRATPHSLGRVGEKEESVREKGRGKSEKEERDYNVSLFPVSITKYFSN